MTARHCLALALALLATACASTAGTQVMPTLAAGEDKLAADKSPAAMLRIADATRAGGDAATAAGLYQRAHELAPSDPVPLTRLGDTLTELRAYTEAAEAYRQAVDLAPNDAEIRRSYAVLLLALNKPQLALTHLDVALAHQKEPRIYNLIGVANDLIGRHDLAQQHYAEGLRLAPENLALRNNLGLSQALAGEYNAAIATLSAAAQDPHATARTRQNLALVYGLSGDSDKAAAVARTDLDEASVKSNLAYYAMLRGMDDRARATAIIGAHRPADGAAAQAASTTAPAPAATAAAPTEPVESAPLPAPAEPVATSLATPPMPHKAPGPIKRTTTARPAPRLPAPVAAAAPQQPATSEPAPQPVAPVTADETETPASAEPAAPVATAAPVEPATAEPAAPPAPAAAAIEAPATTAPTTPPAASQPAVASEEPAPSVPDASSASAEKAPSAGPVAAAGANGGASRRGFLVQVGAFHDAARAQRLCADLTAKGYDLTVSTQRGSTRDWFFCRSTTAASHADAASVAQRLQTQENATALLIPASAQSGS